MRTKMKTLAAALAIVGTAALPTTASAVSVGLELLLLTDVSGSVNSSEYTLQKTGYVNAFNSTTVQNAISATPGGIAVFYGEWSGSTQQSMKVGWTLITNATQASAFAAAISGTTRSFSGSTAPGSALNWATPLFSNNGFEGLREVIDVSGDGSQNDGSSTSAARNAALLAGVDAINGLPILGSEAGLETWYQNNIRGGTGSFVLAANDFVDFQSAIEQKLAREITGTVPEPFSAALVGLGLLGLSLTRRRRC